MRDARWAWLLSAWALWLFATPYIGIDHDARLYVLMALRWLAPQNYARDPWFATGTQDDLSLFSPLFAPLLAGLGIERGAMVATALAGVAFVAGAAFFCRRLLRGSRAWLACLLLVSVPLCYSFNGMLYLREGFVTARTFAVPLSLAGVALALGTRPRLALLAHAAALLVHPLMAVGPAATSAILWLPPRWRVPAVLAGAIAVAAGFLLGGLGRLPVLDGHWHELVNTTPLVFIDTWLPLHLSAMLAWIGLLLLGSRLGSWRARPVYAVAALVALIGVWVSVVAGKHLPLLAYLQGQPWRAIWFAQALGLMAAADLAARHVLRSRAAYRPHLLLLIALALQFPSVLGWLLLGAYAVLATGHLTGWLRRGADRLQPHRKWLWMLATLLLLVRLPDYLLAMHDAYQGLDSPGPLAEGLLGFLKVGGLGLLAAVFWVVLARWRHPGTAALLCLPSLALAASLWDDRPQQQRYQESRYVAGGGGSLFHGLIAPGAVVYWHVAPERVWFELGTSGYASTTHCTGQIYSLSRVELLEMRMIRVAMRGLGEEDRRAALADGVIIERALRPKGTRPGEIRPWVLASYEKKFEEATDFGIHFLCRDTALDYVVDHHRIAGRPIAEARDRAAAREIPIYLYRCADLRTVSPAPTFSDAARDNREAPRPRPPED